MSLKKDASIGWDNISIKLLKKNVIDNLTSTLKKVVFVKMITIKIEIYIISDIDIHCIFKNTWRNNLQEVWYIFWENQILALNQFVFRPGKSTKDAVIQIFFNNVSN